MGIIFTRKFKIAAQTGKLKTKHTLEKVNGTGKPHLYCSQIHGYPHARRLTQGHIYHDHGWFFIQLFYALAKG